MNTVAELLQQLAAQGVTPKGVADDSRHVLPGDLFLAFAGGVVDGRLFIADAIARGAAAVFWEQEGAEAIEGFAQWGGSGHKRTIPGMAVKGLKQLAGGIAHAVFGEPSRRLSLIAVTGTNGKTSCTQWIARAYPHACAIIGTLGAGFPGSLTETGLTTPQATTLARSLSRFVSEGAQACALEASSIGIAEGRINGAHIDVVVLTHLTRDHLDYHGSMESYAAEKEALFTRPDLRVAVLNLDDPFGQRLLQRTTARKKIGYTLEESPVKDATEFDGGVDLLLSAHQIRPEATGMAFLLRMSSQGGGHKGDKGNEDGECHECDVHSRLVGRYNVANLLAVAGALLASGVPFTALAGQLSLLEAPPGRLQRLGGIKAPLVVVDYAHTPDALANALSALREEARARAGRLVCLFGCGGDRDRGKRAPMGEIATAHADEVVLTSDNPRSESPAAIIDDILQGAPGARVIADRRAAIAATIAQAVPGDLILLAGKGHESYQEIAGVRHPFSDFEEAQKALDHYTGGST